MARSAFPSLEEMMQPAATMCWLVGPRPESERAFDLHAYSF